jgi:Reverse transcriptase (RNA-dependent DNA polymerase)
MGCRCQLCLLGSKYTRKGIAGGEFGSLAGHTLLIDKALYGLRSSGLCCHEKFADILRDIGFQQCKAESDIWMRKKLDVYEYIAVYVDDLAIAVIDPGEIVDTLKSKHKLNFKGVGPLAFHLGCDFQRDDDGTLSFGPKKDIEEMIDNYERLFGIKPKG